MNETQKEELDVVTYLKKNGEESLQKEYCITIKQHEKYPELISLSYDQLKSDFKSTIVQACRGLILNKKNNYEIVSFPYWKFFNYCEGNASKIDWDHSPRVYEKIDGSLMIIYYYNNEWNVSTTSLPDARGFIHTPKLLRESEDYKNKKKVSMAELFWKTFKELNYQLPKETDFCFIFELFTPQNQIIVQTKTPKLYLHGCRNLKTYKEDFPEKYAEKYSWECVKPLPLNSLSEILKAAKDLNPIEHEGYVVCDKNFNRVKIKSPSYVALHQSQGIKGNHENKMIEIIKNNESDEFLGYFPHLTDVYQKQKSVYDEIVKDIEKSIKEIEEKNPENLSKYVFQTYPRIGGVLKRLLKDLDGKKLNYLMEKYK
eukprot:gene10963-3671_t